MTHDAVSEINAALEERGQPPLRFGPVEHADRQLAKVAEAEGLTAALGRARSDAGEACNAYRDAWAAIRHVIQNVGYLRAQRQAELDEIDASMLPILRTADSYGFPRADLIAASGLSRATVYRWLGKSFDELAAERDADES